MQEFKFNTVISSQNMVIDFLKGTLSEAFLTILGPVVSIWGKAFFLHILGMCLGYKIPLYVNADSIISRVRLSASSLTGFHGELL